MPALVADGFGIWEGGEGGVVAFGAPSQKSQQRRRPKGSRVRSGRLGSVAERTGLQKVAHTVACSCKFLRRTPCPQRGPMVRDTWPQRAVESQDARGARPDEGDPGWEAVCVYCGMWELSLISGLGIEVRPPLLTWTVVSPCAQQGTRTHTSEKIRGAGVYSLVL